MSNAKSLSCSKTKPIVAALLCGVAALALAVSMTPVQAASASGGASTNSTINLVNLLVKRGIISRQDADALIKQANDEAASARPPASSVAAAAVGPSAAAAAPSSVATVPPADGAVHVTYVPEIVRKQIEDNVRDKVMAEARAGHWAAPDAVPGWIHNIRLSGDIRTRYEGDLFPHGNDNTGSFPNFNAINTGNPFDVSAISNPNFPPELNVDQNRNRFRLRARLALDADLGEDFSAGVRIATGDSNSPVSTNQSLGASGGDFSKYSIWLDRAWIKFAPVDTEEQTLSATVGRFENPFLSTDLIYDDDLNFDGVAMHEKFAIGRFSPFATIGAFAVFNTDLNFASNQPAKFKSDDKYMFAGQVGFDWKFGRASDLQFGVAYYDFDNVRGHLSSPCTIVNAADACDTDDTRPSFAQRGNTYMPLRLIVPTAANDFGTIDQFQYYGLATGYHELAVTGRLDIAHFDPFHILIDAEGVKNLAFQKSGIAAVAVNNRGSIPAGGTIGPFAGGDTGYFVRSTFGAPTLAHAWDWNVNIGYKHLESDAVIDGLTDSDFGLGGTNLQGYIVGGSLALSSNVYTSVRWLSADSIAGPPYAVDIVQFDIGTRF
ncbi:MAG: putative porin [Rhizomicrobium sp.]